MSCSRLFGKRSKGTRALNFFSYYFSAVGAEKGAADVSFTSEEGRREERICLTTGARESEDIRTDGDDALAVDWQLMSL